MPTIIKPNFKKAAGFTLIEVMLVVVLIGLMVSAVSFNFSADQPDQKLEKASLRFAGLFDIAAEYGMLNNIELGVIIDENSYQIVGYDGVRWSEIPDQPNFQRYELPEELKLTLSFDDLAVETPQLFDSKTFIEQQKERQEELEQEDDDRDDDSEEEQKDEEQLLNLLPQIYILSGGEITPFNLIFSFDDEFSYEQLPSYQVTGLYTTPLTIEGPLLEN